jgi:hypothetical protein
MAWLWYNHYSNVRSNYYNTLINNKIPSQQQITESGETTTTHFMGIKFREVMKQYHCAFAM